MYFRTLSAGRRKKKLRLRLNALVTVLFLLSSGVALVNLWDVKPPTATAPRRRKRWWRSAGSARELDIAPGKYVSSALFVMLHLSPANGWPFKTPRCHFRALRNMPFFFILIGGKDLTILRKICERLCVPLLCRIQIRKIIFAKSISRYVKGHKTSFSICLNF